MPAFGVSFIESTAWHSIEGKKRSKEYLHHNLILFWLFGDNQIQPNKVIERNSYLKNIYLKNDVEEYDYFSIEGMENFRN